jgi:methyltransferase (TIGR00027 family)
VEQEVSDGVAHEPSFTAMWHAWMRSAHATTHPSPVYDDTRSIQLVPEATVRDVETLMEGFSADTADALIMMAVIRFRVLADRLSEAGNRGSIQQLVILGAGLDTTAFSLPAFAQHWLVFEVDHPATQEWKRRELAKIGWTLPSNLVFAPCDFETQKLFDALAAVGFDRALPAMVSLFGVILYLTAESTKALLADLASLAPGSEVVMTYSPPPDGIDPVVQQVWDKSSPKVDETGESFIGHYTQAQMQRLVTEAGFSKVIHYSVDVLNAEYLRDRPDGLQVHSIEQLVIAIP